MKNRVIKKAQKLMLVDKMCELQREICEYERFVNDLIIMLSKRRIQVVMEHTCNEWAGWIWDHIENLIQENKELKAKMALAGIKFDAVEGNK